MTIMSPYIPIKGLQFYSYLGKLKHFTEKVPQFRDSDLENASLIINSEAITEPILKWESYVSNILTRLDNHVFPHLPGEGC